MKHDKRMRVGDCAHSRVEVRHVWKTEMYCDSEYEVDWNTGQATIVDIGEQQRGSREREDVLSIKCLDCGALLWNSNSRTHSGTGIARVVYELQKGLVDFITSVT
ncbi:MAG: hypothetical protein RTU30_16340 [Candidatus Thorarchaeota archaeon]